MQKTLIIAFISLMIIIIIGLFNIKPDTYDENMLLQAIEDNDLPKALSLVRKIDQPDITNVYGDTALILAAKKGYNELIVKLMNAGANINKRNFRGYTPLMQATDNGHTDTVKLLVQYKPEFKVLTESDESALTLAIKKNNAEILKFLLESIRDYSGPSESIISMHLGKIIQAASADGDIDTVNVIFASLGTHKITLVEAFAAMNIAVENGYSEIANLIVANAKNINFRDKSSASALLLESARRGYFHLLTKLIENNANVNYQNIEGITPLMAAAQNGWDFCARILIENGADVNLRSKDNFTALDYAVLEGHKTVEEVIRSYIKK